MTNQISVRVDAPEGLPKGLVTITYTPSTVAEFEAIVEAAGGADAFTANEHSLRSSTETHTVSVWPPPGAPARAPRTHPFLAQYMARHSTPDAQERTENMT